jgi:HSP20 family molecular chaperone IbpA
MSSTGSRSRCPGCSTSGGPYCRPSLPAEGFTPLADLEETDDTYLLEVELPGIKKKDINIEVEDRLLVISGKWTEKERTGWLRRQTRSWGRFRHEVVLLDEVVLPDQLTKTTSKPSSTTACCRCGYPRVDRSAPPHRRQVIGTSLFDGQGTARRFSSGRCRSTPWDGDRFIIRFDLPGVDRDSIELTAEKNVLTVRAERTWTPEEGQEAVGAERPQGVFTRQLFLGGSLDVDHITATYDQGCADARRPGGRAGKATQGGDR